MKKKFLIAASAIVAASAGIFAYLNSGSKADDLFSANVEALANEEEGGKVCFKRVKTSIGNETFMCGPCDWVRNTEPELFSGRSTCNR